MRKLKSGYGVTLVLVATLLLAACNNQSGNSGKLAYSSIPADGDAKQGETLFSQKVNDAPECSSCHRLDVNASVGPGIGSLIAAGGTRTGQSPREYMFESIVDPAKYLVTGYSNVMYNLYAEKLSAQQIADLLAYILSFSTT